MRRKKPNIPAIVTSINPITTQNAVVEFSPGKTTFIPKIPEISVSGSTMTLKMVSTRSTSFCRCEMTDSFVDSSPSTTSL